MTSYFLKVSSLFFIFVASNIWKSSYFLPFSSCRLHPLLFALLLHHHQKKNPFLLRGNSNFPMISPFLGKRSLSATRTTIGSKFLTRLLVSLSEDGATLGKVMGNFMNPEGSLRVGKRYLSVTPTTIAFKSSTR